jgi:hypothetical protein
MNQARSIKLINERFSHLAETGPSLFRAEALHNDKPLGIYYFDFSQSIAEPQFDLTSYLQKHLASDYYQREGSLQWNFYLYFILETATLRTLQKSGKAHEVELERTFARKFVRDEDWLVEDLKSNLSVSLYSDSQPKDIASHWVEELSKAGLGKIADAKTAYTTIVDDYIKGDDKAVAAIKQIAQPKTVVNNGKFLECLEIGTFRKHPSKKAFDFGRVNLIRGVNGSGKTSLLEAIELGICGGIRRQDGKCPAKSSLLLKYVGDAEPTKGPVSDASIYRNIDAQWYGGYYRKVNKLCENFGRFNFFDADAGFRLSSGKSAKDIREAIEALFLGEYANSLETIMQRCREKFETKSKEFTDRLARGAIESSKIETDLATVRRIKDTTETLAAELASKCVAGGWLKVPNKMRQSDLLTLEGSIGDICSQLKSNVRAVRWMSGLSLSVLAGEQVKLKEAIKDITVNADKGEKAEKNLGKLNERAEASATKLVLLDRLAEYHKEEGGFKLNGLQEAIEAKRIEYEELKEAASLVKAIDLTAFEKSNSTIVEALKERESDIAAKKRTVNQKKRRIDDLKKQFGEVKSLIEQIRGLGRNLCEHNPALKDCPLCGAEYDSGLLKRIESAKATVSMDKSLRELVSEVASEENLLSAAQEGKASLEQVQKAARLALPETEVTSKTLRSVATQLGSISDFVAAAKTELDRMGATQKRLKLRGFTESELASLIEQASEIYEIASTQIVKASALTTQLESERKRQDGLKKDVKAAEKLAKDLAAESVAVLKRALGSAPTDEPLVELERRLSVVNGALSISKIAKDTFELNQDDDLLVTHDKLKMLGDSVARIRESFKQVEEKDELEKKWVETLAGVRSSMASAKTKNERVKKALEVLDRLLNSKNKSEYLKGIIDVQRDKLVMLFKGIHAPQEFDGVRFNGDIFLSRRGGGDSGLAEISTGQRSALALSIFLSMNSSIGGRAPWLIFDDPIAHIDDLNILSFLDSLRELVISGNRQMFFATANAKVANLFARKFDFLGDSFREIKLDRADS